MAASLTAIVARARRGDERAIAYLLTQSLRSQGIVARGQWQNRILLLDLEAEAAIDPAQTVSHIRRGLERLDLAAPIAAVQVRGRRRGQPQWDWQDYFEVTSAASTPTASTPPSSTPTATTPGLDTSLPQPPTRRPPQEPAAQRPEEQRPEEQRPEEQQPKAQRPEGQLSEGQQPSERAAGDRPPLAAAAAPPPALPPEVPPGEPSAYLSDNTLAALAHLAPLVSYLVVGSQWLGGWPLFWGGSFLLPWRVVAPLALLLIHSPGPGGSSTQRQAKAALNFQLTMLIAWIVTIALMFILVGFLLVIPLALLEIICCVVAAVNATEGKAARYPAIPFVR